ncbi:MAG: magnesium transporter [Bacteroidetes bacterium]|jgi:magnesium transporter|nr:magnesium transporter [Bacteroidota bacterium]
MLAFAATSTSDRPPGLLQVDEAMVEDIAALVAAEDQGMVLNLLVDLHPVDLAVLLARLPEIEARQLFAWLPPELAGDVLAELDAAERGVLLLGISGERLRKLIDELDTDDAVDVLSELPDRRVADVLPKLEDTYDLTALLTYPEQSAGGLMAREFVAVPASVTAFEATEAVRHRARDIDDIYSVFVLTTDGHLKGVVSLKNLMLSPADTPLDDLMETDFVSVPTGMDQEEVARIMERYDLVALPVLDENGVMAGRITIDDVMRVVRTEAEEDMQLMSGVSGAEQPGDSVLRISRGRMPWLLIGLLGAGLSGTVIGTFEATLEQAVVLAAFIPIVTAMGGNAAVQSAAIAVQGLSSGKLWPGDLMRRMGKEMLVAIVNGLLLAALLCLMIFLLQLGDVTRLVLTLGVTMFTVILLATTNGALVPFVLKKMGVDPASAMGPFVTTLNDIIGLTVYFIYASALYL